MLNKDYEYKINLRNKFYKKTINKYSKINKSLQLLNEYNKEIYNHTGGGIEEIKKLIDINAAYTEVMKKEQDTAGQPKIENLESVVEKLTGAATKIKDEITKEQDNITQKLNILNTNMSKLNNTQAFITHVEAEQAMNQLVTKINENVSIRTNVPLDENVPLNVVEPGQELTSSPNVKTLAAAYERRPNVRVKPGIRTIADEGKTE